MAHDTARIAKGLREWLPRGRSITGVRALSTGYSNETYLIEGIDEVLRTPPSEEGLLPPYDIPRQHAIISAVRKHTPTVPLPEVRELCTDPKVIGDSFFLMQRLPGEAFEDTVPDWLAADPVRGCESLCRQWFDAIIGLHRMPTSAMPTDGRTVQQEAQYWLNHAQVAHASRDVIAVLESFTARPPRTSGVPTPVHGDLKQGNCMWHQGRLTGFLDWEMAQIAEPQIDLGYLLISYDSHKALLANAGLDLSGWWSRERMIEEWEKGTGRTAIDIKRYELLGHAKVTAIVARGAYIYDSGKTGDKRLATWGQALPLYTESLVKRAMSAE